MSNIAYKGFKLNKNNQLQCLGMIYELDKEYIIDGELILCENGMHFCWDIKDVSIYYPFHNSTICEVEILGDVVEGDDKACTNKLKVLRILSKDEVMELSNDGIGNNGYFNKGNGNTGNWNKGNSNIGDYNTGDNIIGFFNTISDIGSLDNISIFNKLSNISMEEFKQMEVYGIIYKIDLGWLSANDEKLILQLPNFDKDILDELY